MQKNILVGTYHKTGTVWMYNIFLAIAKELKVPFYYISKHTHFYQTELKSDEGRQAFLIEKGNAPDGSIIFDDQTNFAPIPESLHQNFTGLRVIRDPISVICSAAQYHTWSEEGWLHKPMHKFDQKTYQQAINALDTANERYRFEMQHTCKFTINKMVDFSGFPFMRTFKYEDMIDDRSFVTFSQIFSHLGYEGVTALKAMELVHKHSLFGELKKEESKHIQQAPKKRYGADWDNETINIFKQRFSEKTEQLGYANPFVD